MEMKKYMFTLLMLGSLYFPAFAQAEDTDEEEYEEAEIEAPAEVKPAEVHKNVQLTFAINDGTFSYQRQLQKGFYISIDPSLDWSFSGSQPLMLSPQLGGQIRYNVRYHLKKEKFEKQPFDGLFLSYGVNLNASKLLRNRDLWKWNNSMLSAMGIGYQYSFLQYGYLKFHYQYGVVYNPIASEMQLGSRWEFGIGARIGLGKTSEGKAVMF